MKNKLLKILALAFTCVSLSAFVSCGGGELGNSSSSSDSSSSELSSETSSVSSSEDSSASSEEASSESTVSSEESSSEDSSSEETSNEDVVKNGIAFNTLTVLGDEMVYGKVSNKTESFSFVNEVQVFGTAEFIVLLDMYGIQEVKTKKIPLDIGNNTVYITEFIDGNVTNTYTVTVCRRPMHDVSFNSNGKLIETQTIEEDGFATMPEITPEREGYTFAGWDFDFSTPITSDTTVTAQWKINQYTLTIVYGNGTENKVIKQDYNSAISTVANPEKVGYTFTGWDKAIPSTMPAEDITVTAQWKINQYTLTIVYGNGTENKVIKQDYNSAISTVANPEKVGYTFTGWDKAIPSTMPAEDVTVTAQWKINQYTLTIVYGNGTENKVIKQNYNTAIDETLPTLEKAGYTFTGWDKTIPSTMPAEDVTVTALWKAVFTRNGEEITGLTTHGITLSDIVIPAEMDGVTITSIGRFDYCDNLTSVVIPNSVTSIGSRAFYGCRSLTSVVIPNSVTSIGEDAFYNCINLQYTIKGNLKYLGNATNPYLYLGGTTSSDITSANIDDNCKFIGSEAFYDCTNLTSVVIPNSVTSIGDEAFRECTDLTSVVIPNSVTSIGDFAFWGCNNLQYNVKDNLKYLGNDTNPYLYLAGTTSTDITSVTIDNNCRFIGTSAFLDCDNLTSVVIGDSVTSIGEYAFYSCDNLTSVVIGDSVAHIGEYAFCYCSNLTSVVIPNRVTSIGYRAFLGCDNLTSVVIPNSVTSIGYSAFYNCSNLTSIEVGEKNTAYMSIDGNLYSKDGKTLIQYAVGKKATSFTISDGVTSIGEGAFLDCDNLTSVVIGDSVTSIGGQAFYHCDNLTSVVIGDSVAHIGEYAFCYCSNLTSVVIPNRVTSIGEGAFLGCDNLTSVVIPNSVTSIGSSAFYNCSNLTSIEVGEKNTAYMSIDGNLYSKDGKKLIQYAIGKTATLFTIPDGVTSIGEDAFYSCNNLTSVVIPNSVTSIGDRAFFNCSNLTSVVIPNRVTSIGEGAFLGCDNLTSVVIPNRVTSIGYRAFSACYNLTKVYYAGTASEWDSIDIGYNSEDLINATRYYYVENEADVPADGGKYWHYVNGVPTAW